jgi:hypothetical protein
MHFGNRIMQNKKRNYRLKHNLKVVIINLQYGMKVNLFGFVQFILFGINMQKIQNQSY